MMDLPIAKSIEITQVTREQGALYLESESGVLRLIPLKGNCIRVSFSEQKEFSPLQGARLEISADEDWSFSEAAHAVYLRTTAWMLVIDRTTGCITWNNANGEFLFEDGCRPGVGAREVESFAVWSPEDNDNVKVQKVQTADGVKQRIVSADYQYRGDLYHTRLNMKFSADEKLFGLGQSEEGPWNLRGTTQYLHQANRKIAVPYLLSSKGYGIYMTTESPAIFSDSQDGSWFYTEADQYLDYIVTYGPGLRELTAAFRKLSGKAVLLPRWTFGYVQSQERFESQEEILRVAEEFAKRDIPLDCLVLDWLSWDDGMWGQKSFDASRFPAPDTMIEELHDKGVRFMMSIWPNMTAACENYKEMKAAGQILPGTEIYNAYSEEGRKLYAKQLEEGLWHWGVDAWWCDSSEPLTPEWGRKIKPGAAEMYRQFVEDANNCMPIENSNAYGYYHALGISETPGHGEQAAKDGADAASLKRTVNLTRNGYTGSQKLGTILWSGDIAADWKTLNEQVRAGLIFTTTGLPYWTLDIGAFFVKNGSPWFWRGSYPEGEKDPAYKELYTRWFEYAAFLPIFRAHGTDIRREPWTFGEAGDPCYDALIKTINLRYQLLPYIYTAAGNVWRKDGSLMEMLAAQFGEDANTWDIWDQFMVGDSLMICPILEAAKTYAGSVSRPIYLPKTEDLETWYDYYTGKEYPAGRWINVTAAFDEIPIFVKSGTIIPIQKPCKNTDIQANTPVDLLVFGPNAEGEIYSDAGDGYGYQTGKYCVQHLHCGAGEHQVDVTSEGEERFAVQIGTVTFCGK